MWEEPNPPGPDNDLQGSIGIALGVNALVAGLSYRARFLTIPGAALTALLGLWIYVALGWRGYLIPILFFFVGSLFTRLGYERKLECGVAQKREGIRGAREVLANGLVPLIFTVLIVFADSRLFTIGFTAAWATALCDTTATELGGLWGKRCVLAARLKRVPRGTPGAVSTEGTLAGFLAALALAAAASVLGLVSARVIVPIAVAAVLGSLIESCLAVVLPAPGGIRHELLNVLNTSIGSVLALVWGVLSAATP